MKLKYLLFLSILGPIDALALQKYLVCTGSGYMTVRDVENKTGKTLRYQETKPEQKFETYILGEGRLYNEELKEISECKVSQTLIVCDGSWKTNKWLEGTKFKNSLNINRINGRLKKERINHTETRFNNEISATQVTNVYFEGFCEFKKETKF